MRYSALGFLLAAAASAAALEPVDLAETALRDGMPALAADFATNAVAHAAKPEEAVKAFAILAASNEQTLSDEEFLAWIENVPAPHPDPAWSYYHARALSANHRYPEADALLEKLRKTLPEDSPLATPALLDHAFAQASSGQTAKAIRLLERAHKGNANVTLDLARLLITNGDSEKAAELLRPLVAATDEPIRSARAALLLAKCGYEAGRVDEARRTLAAIDPENESLSRNVRALAIASRAILSIDDSSTNAPAGRLEELARAAALAESQPIRIDCLAAALEVAARFPADPDPLAASAASIVADYPRSPSVAESILAAARTRLALDRPADAETLASLFLSSIPGSPLECDALELRAEALARIPDREEESAAAFLRCAEACPDAERATAFRIRSARELHRAGLSAQAATRLETILADLPEGPLRDEATLLRTACLAETDASAALREALALSTNTTDQATAQAARLNAGLLIGKNADDPTPEGNDAAKTAIAILRGVASAAAAEEPNGDGTSDETSADEAARAAAIQAKAAVAGAVVSIRTRDFQSALDALQLACAIQNGGPSVERAYALLPKVFLALGKDKEASSAFTAFTDKFPDSSYRGDAEFALAAHAFNAGRYEEAAERFEGFAKGRSGDPRHPHALHYAATALFRLARYKDCEETINRLVGECPGFGRMAEARFLLGEAAAQQIDFGKAALAFASVAEDDSAPGELRARARLRRADCLFSFAGSDPEALAKCAALYEALLDDPEAERAGLRWECLFKRARTLEKSGRTDFARQAYYRDLIAPYDAQPDGAAAVWYARAADALADILLHAGERADAIALLEKIVRLDLPGAETARRRLETLQSKTIPTP